MFKGQKRGAAALGHGAEQTAILQGMGVGAVNKGKVSDSCSCVLFVNKVPIDKRALFLTVYPENYMKTNKNAQ